MLSKHDHHLEGNRCSTSMPWSRNACEPSLGRKFDFASERSWARLEERAVRTGASIPQNLWNICHRVVTQHERRRSRQTAVHLKPTNVERFLDLVNSRRIYDITEHRMAGRRRTFHSRLTSIVKQMGVTLEHTGTRTFVYGRFTIGRSSLAMEWKPKQEPPHRSQYAFLRITVGSNAAVFAVSWLGLWPCSQGARIYNNSHHECNRSEQQVKRRVPSLTVTKRSILWSACCGAWTGHKCRSDGCLHCETGMGPT